jgi:uncharacterized RDD family membrane protein YckC
MKCPKCHYIGFETTDRCRNCGYEFALTAEETQPPDLPIASGDEGGPLADFAIRSDPTPASTHAPGRRSPDPDRLFGVPDIDVPAPPSATTPDLPLFGAAPEPPARGPVAPVRHRTPQSGVPRAETPRPPMAERWPSSEPVRPRPRSREDMRVRTATLDLPLPPTTDRESAEVAAPGAHAAPGGVTLAPPALRLAAGAIDAALVGSIDFATVYLTVRLVGLGLSDWHALPLVPLATFFLLLNGGYLALFTAAGGQSIGKMIAGLRVVSADVGPVPLGAASLRALGAMASTVCLGVGLWPAFADEERRALYDRLADTRVVRADS